MNSITLRNVLFIPVLVMAFVACAKSNKDKKAASKAPTAQEQQQDGSANTGALDGANKAEAELPDAKLSYALSCKNPIKLDVADGEQVLPIDELLKDLKGSYKLVQTVSFIESETKEQLLIMGTQMETPADLKAAVNDASKITVVCHNSKEGENTKMRASLDLPNSISAEASSANILRQDTVVLKNGKITSLATSIYQASFDLKSSFAADQITAKVSVVKTANNQVILKKQYNTINSKTGKKEVVTFAGVYESASEKKAQGESQVVVDARVQDAAKASAETENTAR